MLMLYVVGWETQQQKQHCTMYSVCMQVRAAVTKGCREAGVTDTYQASILTAKWMTAQV